MIFFSLENEKLNWVFKTYQSEAIKMESEEIFSKLDEEILLKVYDTIRYANPIEKKCSLRQANKKIDLNGSSCFSVWQCYFKRILQTTQNCNSYETPMRYLCTMQPIHNGIISLKTNEDNKYIKVSSIQERRMEKLPEKVSTI